MKNYFIKANLILLVLILSCGRGAKVGPCPEEPLTDETYPELELIIHYYDSGKSGKTILSQYDHSKTIRVDKDFPLTFIYSGQDKEGMKSIHISIEVEKKLMGEKQTQEYNIMPLTAGCPKPELKDEFILEKKQGKRIVKVQLKGANWMNMRSATKIHTIIIE